MADAHSRLILIGALLSPHGVRGEIKVKSFTDPVENLFSYGPSYHVRRGGDDLARLTLVSWRAAGSSFLGVFEGIETRTQAEDLVGGEILVPRSLLPPPQPGSFYHVDLEGMTVFSASEGLLGTVLRVLNYGASDLLEVLPHDGGRDAPPDHGGEENREEGAPSRVPSRLIAPQKNNKKPPRPGPKTVLVPFVPAQILTCDFALGRLVLDLPFGILPQ